MTKQEAINQLLVMQDSLATMHITNKEKTIAMQMLVGCSQLIAKIDKID